MNNSNSTLNHNREDCLYRNSFHTGNLDKDLNKGNKSKDIDNKSHRSYFNIHDDIVTKSPSLNIVAIDDEQPCLYALDIIFKYSNYKLILIKDSSEGLAYIQNNYKNIDLIILDLLMPGISGMEILELIKQDKNTASIPVIISTASSDVSIMRKCKNMNSKYLRKPYSKDNILSLVKELCYVSIISLLALTIDLPYNNLINKSS